MDSLLKYGFRSLDEYNAFRYTDFCFRKFIEAAEKEAYFRNTVFVFIGDHGIAGDATALLPKAITEQVLTAEHVPLLFYSPALLQPAKNTAIASQLDVLPTIAGICKVGYSNTTLGRNLLDSARMSKDSGANNCAFIIDTERKHIGVIKDPYYYSYGVNGSTYEQIGSIVNNDKVVLTDSLRRQYKGMTDAFYETARYMLLNNKKKTK